MVSLSGIAWNKTGKPNVHSEAHLRQFGLKYLYLFSAEEIEYRIRNYFKFIIVRHPLDRIQSAYTDKVASHNGRYYRKIYDHVIEKYRYKPVDVAEADGGKISLEEFVSFIAHEYPERQDRHYMSFDDICHPCDIKYDYIAKVETLNDDTTNLYKLLLKDEDAEAHLQQLNAHEKITGDRLKVLHKYKDIPRDTMQLFYKKFSLDFDLFGYNFGENGEVVCSSGEDSCC